MNERAIAHIDINSCYAQIEEMLHPEYRHIPMAVGGHEEARHGIILAKNQLAKQYNIKTGETLHEAKEKCPDLQIVHPQYDEYLYYTKLVKDIYHEYSNQVEAFGLDEAWIDLTASASLFGSPLSIVKTIQQRVYDEIGLTVSIGLSYNKIYAKLGSDLIKPSGLVHIRKDNQKQVVFPLPVEDLLYVGRKTKEKLHRWGITTIGQLAQTDRKLMHDRLGKMGDIIWCFANGYDSSEVAFHGQVDPIKSCGNSITTPRDICDAQEAELIFMVLCESVASRLKDDHLKGAVISITLRDCELHSFTRQMKLRKPTNISMELLEHAMELLHKHYAFWLPLRSIGVSVSSLSHDCDEYQLSLFQEEEQRIKQKSIDQVMDQIRNRYGFQAIKRCALLAKPDITDFDPKGSHIIFPVGYF